MGFVWVGIGGALGSMLRYALSLLLTKSWAGFPVAIVFANILGAFVLGLVAASFVKDHPAFLLLGVGVCGGFTTFSAFSLEAWGLFASGKFSAGLLYIAVSVVGSLFAFGLGLYLSRITV